jgi:RNA polymerase sigma factor (sigma-70 family)
VFVQRGESGIAKTLIIHRGIPGSTQRQHQLLHCYPQPPPGARSDRIHDLPGRRGRERPVMEREILRVELLQEIYEEIEELPGRCKEIFKMIFIQGLSTDIIGEQLGISLQTVRTQKARAIGLIRTQLLKKNRLVTLMLLTAVLGRMH